MRVKVLDLEGEPIVTYHKVSEMKVDDERNEIKITFQKDEEDRYYHSTTTISMGRHRIVIS